MIDNFEAIRKILDFQDPKTFYFVQILKRRKDNPEMDTAVAVIDNYFLYGASDLDKIREKILDRCQKHNARAYINPNRLDTEKIALHTMKKIAELLVLKDYRAVRTAYNSVCGTYHSETDKRWVIDIDEGVTHLKERIIEIVNELHTEIKDKDYKIIADLPTRSGFHLITNPFNMQKFREIIERDTKWIDSAYAKIDVQKNSPTILYIP